MLLTSGEAQALLLSGVRVSSKLNFLTCQVPPTGAEGWQQLLEEPEEKENGKLPVPQSEEFLPYADATRSGADPP